MKPNSIKSRFTHRFLRALKRLRKKRSPSASSTQAIFRQYPAVKLAADASMAAAVGPRRVWSRAILFSVTRRGGRRNCDGFAIRRRISMGKREGKLGFVVDDEKIEELRKLVPGGDAMDLYSLLDETAHYIKCLSTQVQVMRNIVNFCSTPT